MSLLPEIDPATVRATSLFACCIVKRYDVRAAILFGSRARQTHRPDSDADVAARLAATPPFDGESVKTHDCLIAACSRPLAESRGRIAPDR